MGVEGVHIAPEYGVNDTILRHDAAGVSNAKALLRACRDLLIAEGIETEIRRNEFLFSNTKVKR
jgi:hypothetical protein